MKSPFEAIIEHFQSLLERSSTNQKSNFDNLNKYIIWVVSFSTGGTALIVSNINSFDLMFPHYLIKILLYLLFVSILSGIVFRYAFFMYNTQIQNIEFYLISAFSNMDIMSVDNENIEDENDINKIINSLKINFDMDFAFMLKDYNQAPEQIKIDTLKLIENPSYAISKISIDSHGKIEIRIYQIDSITEKILGSGPPCYGYLKSLNVEKGDDYFSNSIDRSLYRVILNSQPSSGGSFICQDGRTDRLSFLINNDDARERLLNAFSHLLKLAKNNKEFYYKDPFSK